MGGGGAYPPIYPVPKYGGVSGINSAIYLPSMINGGGCNGTNSNGALSSDAATLGTIERAKFYETQVFSEADIFRNFLDSVIFGIIVYPRQLHNNLY